jgi:phage major head subunit gpT-like protein
VNSRPQRRRRKEERAICAAARGQVIELAADVQWIVGGEAAGDGGDPGTPQPKRFTMTAYTGGAMQVGFGAPVVIDLAGMTAKAPVPILLNHSVDQIVGHADQLELGKSSLKLSGLLSGASPFSAQVEASAGAGFPWRASVGARPDKLEFVGEDVSTTANGKTFKGPLYVARKSTLGEVSFVPLAADSKSSAKVAAGGNPDSQPPFEKETPMLFAQWIEALGFDLDTLTEAQKTALQAKFAAEVAEVKANQKTPAAGAATPPIAAGAPQPAFDLSGLLLAYEKHVAGIEALAAGYTGKIASEKLSEIRGAAGQKAAELKAAALSDEKPPVWLEVQLIKAAADCQVALIRAERPAPPPIHGSARDAEPAVLEAAFAVSAGLRNPEKHYTPEILQAAHTRYRGLGLQETLLLHARAGGYTGRARITQGNLREVLQAAFSSHTITTLLTAASNKILLDGFQAVPSTWRQVAQVRTVSDFKTVTAYRLTADLEYKELAPTGEIQHGTLGQESYSIQAKTYARMLTLTRTDMVNDDLGAFNDLRNRLGIGAALAMNKVFWTAWLAAYNGAAFWTAARGNLVTSAALAEAGLNKAVAAFRKLAGPDGNLLNLEPDRMVVPTDLEATARKLYVSQEQRDTTASTKFPTANIYYNRFNPVVVPEAGISTYTGYSLTTWYLLANPAVLASAIMCFLNGQESPTIESADADFSTLGVEFRGYHDFGASMSEYRASVAAET